MSAVPDPNRCPLCGQSNQCGQSDPATRDQPCWCFEVDIDPQARAQIPPSAEGKACLCMRCARSKTPATP